MAFAAGRTKRLKFGMSVMVLPGRNPIVLAKELATLDRLSGGRLLPAFGLGVADPHEQQAFGVERAARAKLFDEAMVVLRGAWAEGSLTHHGEHFDYEDLRVLPKPMQSHLDVWLGGNAPSELRRVARLADGWLPSFVTPADAERGRETIESGLIEHGRTIDVDHYGALIPYSLGPVPSSVLDVLAKRRPDLADPTILVPQGWDALMKTIDAFVDVGTTKFVILPIVEPATPDLWLEHLEQAAPIVLARQT
jgi:probable F420-dependent oxidoreductase